MSKLNLFLLFIHQWVVSCGLKDPITSFDRASYGFKKISAYAYIFLLKWTITETIPANIKLKLRKCTNTFFHIFSLDLATLVLKVQKVK